MTQTPREKACCALCGKLCFLQDSHLIPKFASHYIERHSRTPRFRDLSQINIIKQGGMKMPLLCSDCEEKISAWEAYFSKHVFYPYYEGQAEFKCNEAPVNRFLISVAFRGMEKVLRAPDGRLSLYTLAKITSSRDVFKDYLNGLRPDTDGFPMGACIYTPEFVKNCFPHRSMEAVLSYVDESYGFDVITLPISNIQTFISHFGHFFFCCVLPDEPALYAALKPNDPEIGSIMENAILYSIKTGIERMLESASELTPNQRRKIEMSYREYLRDTKNKSAKR